MAAAWREHMADFAVDFDVAHFDGELSGEKKQRTSLGDLMFDRCVGQTPFDLRVARPSEGPALLAEKAPLHACAEITGTVVPVAGLAALVRVRPWHFDLELDALADAVV